MESNGNNRGGLLSAGGILCIISGITQVMNVASAVIILSPEWWFAPLPSVLALPLIRYGFWQSGVYGSEGWVRVVFVVCAVALGIVSIVGGISAIRRKRFGLSLAGAICAVPSGTLGIMAVVFVGLGKREFRAKVKEDGI